MKKLIYLSVMLLFAFQMKGQVNDISLNVTPTFNYTWWDNQLYIKNGPMVGGMLGVGLGRNLELRGVYERSLDLKSTLNDLKVPDDIVDKFSAREVDIERWGGEFKANIPTGGIIAPYLTLGTGVQKLKYDDLKHEQIYLSGGLGTKFNLGERIALNLEGKFHAFNLDPSSVLRVDNPEGDAFNDWIDNNITSERMMNWSLNVGLQFYLGGKTESNYTAFDRAMDAQYANGLKGLRFVMEPGLAYIDFDGSTNLRDTYLLGGALGFDFNDYIGIRGFYYRSTEDEKLSTNFDKLALYGTDFIAKLNVARGVVPYISVGGGYLNVNDNYVGEMSLLPTNSSYFAKGGVGLTVPLSRYFEIFGAANLLLTTDKDEVMDVESTEDLKKHTMFNAGLKFNVGKAINAKRTIDSYVERSMSDKAMMYEQRIAELQKELDKAYARNDAASAAKILSEKQRLETEIVASSEKQVGAASTYTTTDGQTLIRLTPDELESLVDKVVKGVGKPALRQETPEERLDRLENVILRGAKPQGTPYVMQQTDTAQSQRMANEYVSEAISSSNREMLNELKRINDRIEENSRKIDNAYRQQGGSDRTYIVSPGGNQTPYMAPSVGRDNVVVSPDGRRQSTGAFSSPRERATSWVIYKGLSPFLAINMGDATAGLFGIKANYGFSSTDFIFSPDLYFGVGGKVAYGLNANISYPLLATNYSMFNPYVGIGLGMNKIQKFNFGINFIGGTYLDVGNGSMFVEYTSRRFFKSNQLSIGYRFDF